MEEKRNKLIEKMTAEHLEFKAALLAMSKEEILEHAEDYCTQLLIRRMLPDIGIQEADYDVLLAMDNPLTEATEYWNSIEQEFGEAISATLIEIAGGDTSIYD